MKPALFLLVAALLLPACAEATADHATIFNRGTLPARLHVAFSSSDGDVVHEETRTLEPGKSFEFPLDHPGDGDYRLVVEADDGRSGSMTLTWQGSTGPGRVRFYVHDDPDRRGAARHVMDDALAANRTGSWSGPAGI